MKIKKTVIRVKKICIWNPNKQRKKKSSGSTFRPFSQEPNATCIGSSLVILVQFLSNQTDTKHKIFQTLVPLNASINSTSENKKKPPSKAREPKRCVLVINDNCYCFLNLTREKKKKARDRTRETELKTQRFEDQRESSTVLLLFMCTARVKQ